MFTWMKRYNIPFWILSFVLAVILWLYVTAMSDSETYKEISGIRPKFIGVETLLAEQDLEIIAGLDTTVSLTLRGRRTDLALCNENNIELTVNVADITNVGRSNLTYTEKLPVSGPTIVARSNSYIGLVTDRLISRDLRVEAILDGCTFAPNYLLTKSELSPESVRVRGPSATLNKLSHIAVYPQKQDIDRTVTLPLPFAVIDTEGNAVPQDDLTFDTEDILLTLRVSMRKEVALAINIVEGGGALARNAIYTISPETVQLIGDPAVLEGINTIVLGNIDLAQVVQETRQSFPIVIPNNTENLSGVQNADVTVEIRGLETARHNVDNITIVGARPPTGYEAKLVTQMLQILIRGPKESVDLVPVHNIRVVADLTDVILSPGNLVTVTARVYIDGYADVGAVGEQRVVIDVVPITRTAE